LTANYKTLQYTTLRLQDVYDPENGSPKSPRLTKVRQAKSKIKSMIIIFFDIKGIVHKEFILAGQTV
jgi:hypothetical protein